MVGFFYMIYDFPCIINKPSFYVIDVHAVLIVKDITGTIQYQHYHLPPSPPPFYPSKIWNELLQCQAL